MFTCMYSFPPAACPFLTFPSGPVGPKKNPNNMRAVPSSIPCHLRDVGESSAEPGCSIQAILLCGAILRRGRKSLKRHIDWRHIFITLELPPLLPVPHTISLQKPIESKSKKIQPKCLSKPQQQSPTLAGVYSS